MRGSVVLVRVRFTDDQRVKRRPAIIVSVDAVHDARADAVIVPLTSRLDVRRFGDVLLQDWKAAGLPRPSMAKGILATVDRSTFGPTLGELSDRDLDAIGFSLRNVLGV